jgi:2-phosphoglycolate phosphatase
MPYTEPTVTDVSPGSGILGVVFDLDGTLVDSRGDIVGAVKVALSRHDVAPPDADVIAGFVGDGARLLIARALGVPEHDARVDPVLATYLTYYEEHPVDHTVPMPGALATLDALAGVPLAVCTNKPRRIADSVLARLGLSGRFAVVVGGGDTALAKPHAAPLLRVAEQLGHHPGALAMVGDGVQDIACGRAAGAFAVGVLGGFGTPDALRDARPDLLISSLSELAPALYPDRYGKPPSRSLGIPK